MQLLRANLNDEQFEVARIQNENLLVLSPPGSGKTRVLINAAAHRLRERPDSATRVLCLTFSTEAAREMRRRLSDPQLHAPASRCWAGNYHQLGAHLLRGYGHLLGWPRDAGLLVPPDNHRLIEQILADLNLHNVDVRSTADAISSLKGRRHNHEAPLPARTLRAISDRYQKVLHDRHLRDFDDLIVDTTRLLRQTPALRALLHDAYPFVFVDELQDTNRIQLDLLAELIGPTTQVFAVADDDQMIYGWRDAHPTNIAEFVDRFAAREVALTGNYRCPPRIVAAANAIIAANQRRRTVFMHSMVTDWQGEVLLGGAQGQYAEAQLVAQVVQQALDEGVPAGQIAILAPVRFLFNRVYPELEARRIPYVRLGSDELRRNPSVAVLRLCLVGLAGGTITNDDLDQLPPWPSGQPGLARIDRAIGTAKPLRPRAMLPELLAKLGLGSLREPTQDARWVRLFARMVRRAIDETAPASTDLLARTVLLEWDRLEAAALKAEHAVKVMTSFLAKGTEYDVVVLPFLNDGRVPYQRTGATIDWEEARRLFYVAITRARRRIVLIRDLEQPDSELLSLLRGPLVTSLPVVSQAATAARSA